VAATENVCKYTDASFFINNALLSAS